MNKKYVIVSILIGCIVGSVFVYIFRRTEDNKTSNMRHKTALYTAKPAEKTTPVQENDAEQIQGKAQEIDVNQPLRKRRKGMNRTEHELTGFPSIDKPWLKYYSEEVIQTSLPQKTLYGYLYENNRNHMESTALNYLGNRITYQKFFEHIKETAIAFTTAGIKSGDMVTILSLLTPETIYCIYALNYIGAVANMGYLSLSEDEIVQMVEKTNSKAIIVLDVVAEKVMRVQEKLTSDMTIILSVESSMPWLMKSMIELKKWKKLSYDGKQMLSYVSFIKKYAGQGHAVEVMWEKDNPAVLVYTSGTTGEPKGVVLTNDNINAVAFQYRYSRLKFRTGEKNSCIYAAFCNRILPECAYAIGAWFRRSPRT